MILITYRPFDAELATGRLIGHLEHAFAPDQLIVDPVSGRPGVDVLRQVEVAVRRSEIVLTVIGPHWVSAQDHQGRRRIDRDNDPVRLQVLAALFYRRVIIPVLVEGAEGPTWGELPAGIRPLAGLSSFRIRPGAFLTDVRRLTDYLRQTLGDEDGEFSRTEEWPLADLQRLRAWSDRRDARPPPTVAVRNTIDVPLPRTVLDNPPLLAPSSDQREAPQSESPGPRASIPASDTAQPTYEGPVAPDQALLVIDDDTVIDVVKRRLGSRLMKKLVE